MKALLLVLLTAAVSGCAVYPAPYRVYGAGPQPYVVQPAPVVIYGRGGYRYGGDGRAYSQPAPSTRDLDGDGVPNRWDSQPYDPRRR